MLTRLTSASLAAAICVLAGNATAGILTPEEHNQLVAQLERRPMVFFVAKGPADSCGRGCSEWIAAVGKFEAGTAQRFREFMEKLAGRDLPIFFHSPGGSAKGGVELGLILREKRMTAGVGRTETKQCRVFDRHDSDCQTLIKSGTAVNARLLTREGQCHSACVDAFAGASVRRLEPGSLLGVHSPRFDRKAQKASEKTGKETKVPTAAIQNFTRRYYVEMGISPFLVDLAGKTSAQRMYILSRGEIASFGLETRGVYETPWLAHASDKIISVTKVVTQPTTDTSEYLTTKFALWCDLAGGWTNFGYDRQLPRKGSSEAMAIHLKIDTGYFTFETKRGSRANELGRVQYGNKQDILENGVGKNITLIETPLGPERQPAGTRAINLSTAGLAEALAEFKSRCVPRALVPPTSTVLQDPKLMPTSAVFPAPHQRVPIPQVFSPPQQSESTPELSPGAGQ